MFKYKKGAVRIYQVS